MATEKQSKVIDLATQATMRRTTVRLNELKVDPARYCHRADGALGEPALQGLLASLASERLQVPIEYALDPQGQKVLIKGHRRHAACKILAGKNTPGFTEDMEVEAIEVQNATPEDLLVRSVADNEIRLNLDRVHRIKVAQKLSAAGVQNERAARALGISAKSYERDLLIARHGWMLQHVEDQSVPPTDAYLLLHQADKHGRVRELKEDLEIWVADKKKLVREKEKSKKITANKELRPSERTVKRYLNKTLLSHWLELLKAGKRFDEDARWNFAAGIERESGQLHISTVKLDLNKEEPEKIAKVASKLSQLAKELRPHLRRRFEELRRQDDRGGTEKVYDFEYLRELGLEECAEEIEEELEQALAADGEEDPEHDRNEERTEADLTRVVGDLPETMPEPDLAAAPEPAATPPPAAPQPAVAPQPPAAAPQPPAAAPQPPQASEGPA